MHTSVGKAHDIDGGVGGDSVARYDAMLLGDQFLDVPKEHRAFIFRGVKFFSTFRPRKVKSLFSFKTLRTSYLVT
jgi:hypothetical protein